MISKTTIAQYRLTPAAVEALEGVGCTDATVADDVAKVVAGGLDALAAECLEGADYIEGWTEYLSSVEAAAIAKVTP